MTNTKTQITNGRVDRAVRAVLAGRGAGGMSGDAGFWRLEHDGLAALLARSDLSWETARVYLALADLTIGFGKRKVVVSVSQIGKVAGIPDRGHVQRALNRLAGLGLYGQCEADGQRVTRWVVWPCPPVAKAGSSSPLSRVSQKIAWRTEKGVMAAVCFG